MKEYCSDNNFDRHRRKKPKRRTLRISLVLICCLIVAALAVGLLADGFPVDINRRLDGHLFSDAAIDTDFNAGLAVGAQSKADNTAWHLILVNRWNYVPYGYEVELTKLSNGQSVDKRIYPALQEMFDAARMENVYPAVISGYRTPEKQQRLLDEKVADYMAEGCSAEEAVSKAEAWVALPGTSEHELGIAVDIGAESIRSADEEVYKWLDLNSYKYGFIRRYMADKTEITGVIGEPWHYRYVGVQAAAEIYAQDICLEEYLN